MIKQKTLLVLLFFIKLGFSQYTVTGTLINENNEPLPFAKVFFKNQNVFTHSDLNGEFLIRSGQRLTNFDTLEIRYVGYVDLKIGLNPRKTSLNKIVLKRENNLLSEVAVVAPPPVDEILDNMYKNIPLNYTDTAMRFEGFYREIMTENERFIELNECVIDIHYDKYPIKRGKFKPLDKKDYSYCWDNQFTYFFRTDGEVFKCSEYFPAFVGNGDSLQFISGRESNNLSGYGKMVAPVGGPNDLIAQDKLKYNYDFLDRKNKDRYDYRNNGKVMKNGVVCYEIAFKVIPYDELNALQKIEPWGLGWSKFRHGRYNGVLYISVDDFALTSFKCQYFTVMKMISKGNTSARRFGFPDLLTIEVDYKKNGKGKYELNRVDVNQTINEKIKDEVVVYTCQRTLDLFPVPQNVDYKPEEERLFFNGDRLRDKVNQYDPEFWETYRKSKKYPALTRHQMDDLTGKRTLEEQFLDLNIKIPEIAKPAFDEVAQTLAGLIIITDITKK